MPFCCGMNEMGWVGGFQKYAGEGVVVKSAGSRRKRRTAVPLSIGWVVRPWGGGTGGRSRVGGRRRVGPSQTSKRGR